MILLIIFPRQWHTGIGEYFWISCNARICWQKDQIAQQFKSSDNQPQPKINTELIHDGANNNSIFYPKPQSS
jgi:hypothetical protein